MNNDQRSVIVKRRFAVMLEDAIQVSVPDGVTDPEEWAIENYDTILAAACTNRDDAQKGTPPTAELDAAWLWEDNHHADLDFPDTEWEVTDPDHPEVAFPDGESPAQIVAREITDYLAAFGDPPSGTDLVHAAEFVKVLTDMASCGQPDIAILDEAYKNLLVTAWGFDRDRVPSITEHPNARR